MIATSFNLSSAADDKPLLAVPVVNPGSFTPAIPVQPLTAEQVESIVDRAVQRAMSQNQAFAAPQSAAATIAPMATQTVAAPQQVHVLVYPGPLQQAMARFGARLVRLGDPKVRPMVISSTQTTLTNAPSVAPSAAATLFVPAASAQR